MKLLELRNSLNLFTELDQDAAVYAIGHTLMISSKKFSTEMIGTSNVIMLQQTGWRHEQVADVYYWKLSL